MQPAGSNPRWAIFAIPAAAVALPLAVALITLAVRPTKEPDQTALRAIPPAPARPPAEQSLEPAGVEPASAPVAVQSNKAPASASFASNTPPMLLPQNIAPAA